MSSPSCCIVPSNGATSTGLVRQRAYPRAWHGARSSGASTALTRMTGSDRVCASPCIRWSPWSPVRPGSCRARIHEQRERKVSPGGLPCGTAEIDGVLPIVERSDGVGDVRPPQGFRDEDGMATIVVDYQNRTRMYQGHGRSPSLRGLRAGLGTGLSARADGSPG